MLILAHLIDKKAAGNVSLLCLPGIFHHFAILKIRNLNYLNNFTVVYGGFFVLFFWVWGFFCMGFFFSV